MLSVLDDGGFVKSGNGKSKRKSLAELDEINWAARKCQRHDQERALLYAEKTQRIDEAFERGWLRIKQVTLVTGGHRYHLPVEELPPTVKRALQRMLNEGLSQ